MTDRVVTIALAGNPNSGKTTMFNELTGSSQRVGNWPGVTVEKKEGRLKGRKDVIVQDLPGIYSLAPYSPEEVISRTYLVKERPSAVIDIVDASNLERNLYLTTQLVELGIPVVLALNMIDVVQKRGDAIDLKRLSQMLGVAVVETSALKGQGCANAAEKAQQLAAEQAQHRLRTGAGPVGHDAPGAPVDHDAPGAPVGHDAPGTPVAPTRFSAPVEAALHAIGAVIESQVKDANVRWYSIKFFERDQEIAGRFELDDAQRAAIEDAVKAVEDAYDDDSESVIANERYAFIGEVVAATLTVRDEGAPTVSDRIDRVVTNRVLALPIFALVMFLVYFLAVSSVGTLATDWANDGVFGDGWHLFGIGAVEYGEALGAYEDAALPAGAPDTAEAAAPEGDAPDPASFGIWVPGVPVLLEAALEAAGTAEWLNSLLLGGIVAGVGAVLGFLPQMLILFLLLALLEDCGYMARIAFIMDRVFKRFGLSGKSFIPILIGTGCGVPGILASRTIENESNRRLTVMTTTFIPCSAKLPIIALISGALFPGSLWVAPSAYFIGIAAIVCSGIILKKVRLFAGDPSPFLIELPAYHLPRPVGVLRVMLERGGAFVKRAGTIILLATVLVWFLSTFDWTMRMVDTNDSMLAAIGGAVAPVFDPLGWGDWRATTATVTGLIAKENVVGTFGVLYGFAEVAEDGADYWPVLVASFTQLAAFSFLLFNLLCAPCFAAIGAIHREMASPRWTLIAVGYQCVFAYFVAFSVYQVGLLVTGAGFTAASAVALLLIAGFLFLLFRPAPRTPSPLSAQGGAG
ncbi:MAG: ferrous iron transporter B [Coriobacteriales bacterium]|nr:ferrous iron transporter B [Coriobacteriales bacterium]